MKIIVPAQIDDTKITSTNVTDTTQVWASDTTYAEGEEVQYENNIYESLQDANTGNMPDAEDSTWWVFLRANNIFRAFDNIVGTKTTRADLIEYVLSTGQNTTGVSLLNLAGLTVDIIVNDPTEGEVYNETIGLLSTDNVYDGYTYCFAPFLYDSHIVKTDIPPYPNASITIQVTQETGQTAEVGEIVVGESMEIGTTLYGADVGIQDYSRKERDIFGNFDILERAFSKRANYPIVVENGLINSLIRVLSQIRATPVVWVGTEIDDCASAFLVYGYYRDFSVVVPHPAYAECNLEIEGLT